MNGFKFLFTIDCVFHILNKGILVTGYIEQGSVRQGEQLELLGKNGIFPICNKMEKYLKPVTKAKQGEDIAIYLTDVDKSELDKGIKLAIRK